MPKDAREIRKQRNVVSFLICMVSIFEASATTIKISKIANSRNVP
jgi:hypothetical protein